VSPRTLRLAAPLAAAGCLLLLCQCRDTPTDPPAAAPVQAAPERGQPCSVQVAVNRTGVPLPQAEIELLGDGFPLRRLSARSDASGVAAFQVPPGRYHATGALPGFGLVQGDQLRCLGRGERLRASVAFFEARTRVRLRVTDAAGAPLADALVTTRRVRGEKQQGVSAVHATGPGGLLELGLPLDAAAYDLVVEAERHLPATRSVPADQPEVSIELALAPRP